MDTDITPEEKRIRSTTIKAQATALINQYSKDSPIPFTSIFHSLEATMEELKYGSPETSLRSLLDTMANNDLIGRAKEGVHVTFYGLGAAAARAAPPKEAKVAKPKVAPPQPAAPAPVSVVGETPAIKIDIVKATGNVRLSIQGLVIEIGVVAK